MEGASMCVLHIVRALTGWAKMSGSEQALELAGKLTNFAVKSKFWGDGEHAGFAISHHHAQLMVLRAILEYAALINNDRLKEFVRDGYEYMRRLGINRMGCFAYNTEACSTSDMVALAIRLYDAGIGDYWDDVDRYLRNQLVEQQWVSADQLREVAGFGPDHVVHSPQETDKRVIESNVGNFAKTLSPTVLRPHTCICCSCNPAQTLYYAWEGIVRHENDATQINLLLNRISPWVDVESHLPYEGKAILRNKSERKIHVRIPGWVDKKAVRTQVNGQGRPQAWLGRYLLLDDLNGDEEVSIEFPMVEAVEKHIIEVTEGHVPENGEHLRAKEYTCRFKGNTLVDISPRDDVEARTITRKGKDGVISTTTIKGIPMYLRDHYKADKALMKQVTRFIPAKLFSW